MQQFLFRRIGFAFLALFALSILTFALVRPERYDVRYVWGNLVPVWLKSDNWSSSTPAI